MWKIYIYQLIQPIISKNSIYSEQIQNYLNSNWSRYWGYFNADQSVESIQTILKNDLEFLIKNLTELNLHAEIEKQKIINDELANKKIKLNDKKDLLVSLVIMGLLILIVKAI